MNHVNIERNIQGGPMKTLFFALVVSICAQGAFISPCFADNKIEDPNQVLVKADEFLGTLSFSQSFTLNDKATFTNYTNTCEYGCEEGACWSTCEMSERPAITHVYTCNESSVTYGNDEGTLYMELNKEQFDALNGNLARYVFLHLEDLFRLPGTLKLNKTTMGKYKDELSAVGKEYDSMTLWGEYALENGSGQFEVILTVAKNVPAIAQVIRLRLGDQTIYRLKGIN